jgi:hypothetical protein
MLFFVRLCFLLPSLLFLFTPISAINDLVTKKQLVFIPLDERFATRGLFLHLSELCSSEFEIVTPPSSMISKLHKPANLPALDNWLNSTLPKADILIVSLEMYVYGGLIASRESNDTLAVVSERAQTLFSLKGRYPTLKVFTSSVVMRIPAYNGAFEEPWYWEDYGLDLYEYSFYSSRFNALGNPDDATLRDAYSAMVPPNAMEQFLWRRERNANVSMLLLNALAAPPPDESGLAKAFDAFFITEDDSSSFGFNVDEADRLRSSISALGLNEDIVRVYPGADEVQSVMLSRAAIHSRIEDRALCATIVYRNPEAQRLEPNYESQNLSSTVQAQLEAAGLSVCREGDETRLTLVVNNFDSYPQLEASEQPPLNETAGSAFRSLEAILDSCIPEKGQILAFADSRYSNGGDEDFSMFLQNRIITERQGAGGCLSSNSFAYAAWNTNGNTLGTAISNGVLLELFGRSPASVRFTLLRFVEDLNYQADVRQSLVTYVQSSLDEVTDLSVDLTFYEHYTLKPLRARAAEWSQLLSPLAQLPGLRSVFYPWNRTFEVGLVLDPYDNVKAIEEHVEESDRFTETNEVYCDIVIAGGSTSALAAAIAAADTAARGVFGDGGNLAVCLTEPTSWPGGQLTSSLVTAIDFGPYNALEPNMPFEFANLASILGMDELNPGQCWVSESCYEAIDLLKDYIWPAIRSRSNLKVLLDSVVKEVRMDEISGKINDVRIVRSKSRPHATGFRSSEEEIRDRYSLDDSEYLQKDLLRLSRGNSLEKDDPALIVVDATELGDVLALSSSFGVGWTQGYDDTDAPVDSSTCGQAITYPFYLELLDPNVTDNRPPTVWAAQPPTSKYSLNTFTIDQVWTYRRAQLADWTDSGSADVAVPGDVSLTAWGSGAGDGNDFPFGYHLLSSSETQAQAASGDWTGGVNFDVLCSAEEYSLGFASWFHDLANENAKSDDTWDGGLRIDNLKAGTTSGLSKLPYIRDTRRAIGVDGFRLSGTDLTVDESAPPIPCESGDVPTARRFKGEEVALGNYLYFDAHTLDENSTGCSPPAFPGQPLAPYFVPFRALTSNEVSNLLVCGKTMAQDFAANAATRLHPVEWSTGAAAGVSAVLLASSVKTDEGNDLTTSDLAASSDLLTMLRTEISLNHAPLEWAACPE